LSFKSLKISVFVVGCSALVTAFWVLLNQLSPARRYSCWLQIIQMANKKYSHINISYNERL